MNRSGDQLGTMSFELTSIYASGGPDFPLLTIRADVALSPFIERGQQPVSVHPLSLIRAVGQLRSPEHRVVARFQEDIALLADNPNYANTTQVAFEIPLGIETINRIEKDRGSTDLRIQLTFQLLFGLHVNGNVAFHGGRVDGLTFLIPRSQWIDNLLPGLGYGGLEVLEIRYGSGVIAQQLPKSVQEIQEAKKCLFDGHWEKSAVHCRKAVEALLDCGSSALPVTTRFREKLSTWMSDNLKADDAEAKLLAGQMQLVWDVTSPAAHPAPAHTFSRRDAEFLVRSTMALVEYVSRLLN
jgi:hypothetical protein